MCIHKAKLQNTYVYDISIGGAIIKRWVKSWAFFNEKKCKYGKNAWRTMLTSMTICSKMLETELDKKTLQWKYWDTHSTGWKCLWSAQFYYNPETKCSKQWKMISEMSLLIFRWWGVIVVICPKLLWSKTVALNIWCEFILHWLLVYHVNHI